MEDKTKQPEVIDLRVIARQIWSRKRLFLKTLPVVFVLSCIYILSIPRYYVSDILLAPEMEMATSGGALSSIASSFGIDLSQSGGTDAITPLLYPDLLEDNGFASSLMGIRVKSQDGEIDATYHDYLKHLQKKAWWMYPVDWVKKLLPKTPDKGGSKTGYDPYNLTRAENSVLLKARKNIDIGIDKKTGVISISVEAQDPLICKMLADSIKDRLQVFITDYRTNKARIDYDYYKGLAMNAKHEYEKLRQMYASMSDANTNVVLHSVELKIQDMENDMQLKYNTYTALMGQLDGAAAKVQERTPAFTVLKGAAVPVKATGPKRMLFVLGMLILGMIGTVVYILKDSLLVPLRKKS